MRKLMKRLAERMKVDPFIVDQSGSYHLCVDGFSLFLEPVGTQLVIRSPLDRMMSREVPIDLHALRFALEMVTCWARYCPQALAISPHGSLVLEARLELDWHDVDVLEDVLATQVDVLELLHSEKLKVRTGPKWSPAIWRP